MPRLATKIGDSIYERYREEEKEELHKDKIIEENIRNLRRSRNSVGPEHSRLSNSVGPEHTITIGVGYSDIDAKVVPSGWSIPTPTSIVFSSSSTRSVDRSSSMLIISSSWSFSSSLYFSNSLNISLILILFSIFSSTFSIKTSLCFFVVG